MGSIVSSMFGGAGRTDDPDPTTGLTSRDRYLVTSSWAKLMKNPTDSGVALLTLFFKKYPEYIQLFPFKDANPEEFPTNARFRAHCNSVVYALSAIVDNLDVPDVLIELLTKTGSTHIRRKVTKEGFLHLKETAIELFSTLFKPEELDAWKKTFDVAFDVIIQGLESGKVD